MATILWKNTTSGSWSLAANWFTGVVPGVGDDVLFNPGAFTATIAEGTTFEVHSLIQNGSTTTVNGVLRLDDPSAVGVGGRIDGGSALAHTGLITSGSVTGTLTNEGVIEANLNGGVLQIDTVGFTNKGAVIASNGAILFITSANFSNLAGGVLTGGTYEISGNGTAMDIVGGFDGGSNFFDARVTTNNATITLNGPGSFLFGYNPAISGYNTLETSLTTIGAAGVLNNIGGRNYTSTNSLANAGVLALGGGTFDVGSLTNNGGGIIVGYGTIADTIANGGRIEAQLGTLTLANGITNTGQVQIDALATLSFNGTYSQSVANAGTIAVPGGTLLLNGPVTGTGGYFIAGGSVGAVTTLDLAAVVSGNVAFNGAFGALKLTAPGSFTGNIVGFGTGDTIDLAGIVSNSATLVGNTLNILNGGTIVYRLPLIGDYTGASFSGASDGSGGTKVTVSGVEPRHFVLEGPVWANRTLTWSIAAFQYQASFDLAHPFSSSINETGQAAFVSVIQLAFDRWANIAGLNFVKVPDTNISTQAADIRIGWGNLLGTGGEIGEAAFNTLGIYFQPDSIVRLQDPAITALVADPGVIGGFTYTGLSSTLYQIAVHEIGHAIGLGHSNDSAAVMFPTAQGVHNQDTNASDAAGIIALYANIPCFADGTRILTANGEVAVERLRIGDLVPTALAGRLRRIRWIGHRMVMPQTHPNADDVTPVEIRAGAFGDGLPRRDLRLSPDHAVFADGALVPVRHLVNGATIRRVAVQRVTYFHIELADADGQAAHDVLLAEGLPAESFLDTGNRDAFANAGVTAAQPDFARRIWDAAGCAPLHLGGRVVAGLRARLRMTAEGAGFVVTDRPDLMIESGGRLHAGRPSAHGAWRFTLPAGIATLHSRAAVPADIRADDTDRRTLGIAVAGLRHDGQPIALADPRLGAGWHGVETAGRRRWRWTGGAAQIALETAGILEIRLGPTMDYWITPDAASAVFAAAAEG